MDFNDERRVKWIRGREDRGLLDSEAFEGDAALKIAEEAMDAANYSDQLLLEGRITVEEHWHSLEIAQELYYWSQLVKS